MTNPMAERGPTPELDLHLLECPICLERLRQPKSLPCLHCFCQDCLGTYITKELSGKISSATSFPCPICRRMTPPVNPADPQDKWAEQFPTNAVIQDHIQLNERSSEPLYCNYAMGKIVAEKQPRRISDSHCNLEPPLSERRVKEIGKFNIKTSSDKDDCCACGVVYLPCDQIVVSDCSNNKLKLFTDNGQYLDELTVRGEPRDLCLVNSFTVAVAIAGPGGVRVVKVETSKLTLSSEINMSNGESCHGITHTEGRFIVSTTYGGVYSVTQDGVTDLLHKYDIYCCCLTCDVIIPGDTLVSVYNSTTGNVAVSRLSADKRHTDVMKVGVVRLAIGIDVDREGNIYVCGYDSHNVVQMSGDGTHVRDLLKSSDGIHSPLAIAVRGDTFVVTNGSDTDEDNYISVFQLY